MRWIHAVLLTVGVFVFIAVRVAHPIPWRPPHPSATLDDGGVVIDRSHHTGDGGSSWRHDNLRHAKEDDHRLDPPHTASPTKKAIGLASCGHFMRNFSIVSIGDTTLLYHDMRESGNVMTAASWDRPDASGQTEQRVDGDENRHRRMGGGAQTTTFFAAALQDHLRQRVRQAVEVSDCGAMSLHDGMVHISSLSFNTAERQHDKLHSVHRTTNTGDDNERLNFTAEAILAYRDTDGLLEANVASADWVTIHLGTYDSALWLGKPSRGQAVQKLRSRFRSSLIRLLRRLHQWNKDASILLVTPPPAFPNPIPILGAAAAAAIQEGSACYVEHHILPGIIGKDIRDGIKEVGEEHVAPAFVCDVFAELQRSDATLATLVARFPQGTCPPRNVERDASAVALYFTDGIRPTNRSMEAIVNVVGDTLMRHLWSTHA